MKDADKTKKQLINELRKLRQRISELETSEARFKRVNSEEKSRTFMETASDLMHIADKDGNFAHVNESMARTLGYCKEEMVGMHITQVLSKEALEEDFKSTKGEISLETAWVTKDGKEIYGELSFAENYRITQ